MSPRLAGQHKGKYVEDIQPDYLEPGWYCRFDDTFYGKTPNGILINLSRGNVTIFHEDTLTCEGPISAEYGDLKWEGQLVKGVWIES